MEIIITQKNGEENIVIVDDDFNYKNKIYMNHDYVSIWMNNKHVPLHRYIMDVHNGDRKIVVDHINHNKLDNRRCNLRLCNNVDNVRNNIKAKGYSYEKFTRKYKAYIMVNKKYKTLGRFDSPEEAQQVYRKAHAEAFGEFSPYYEYYSGITKEVN